MVKATAVLSSNEGVSGTVYFTEEGVGRTMVIENLSGLRPGLHGFHVHGLGDTANGCMSADLVVALYTELWRACVGLLITDRP